MIVAKFSGSCSTSVYGLTQWDYGQFLQIEYPGVILDGSEVNFYQGLLSSMGYIQDLKVRIPDRMLQNADDIMAYVYVREPNSGETILSIRMSVETRPRPDNYVLPNMEEYRRLLPDGGLPGQIPVKQDGGEYAVGWGYKADSLSVNDGYLQLLSGNEKIGERVRVVSGGREIELTNDGTNIKWRYTDSNEWHTLVSLLSLTGPPGVTPEFEIREGHLIVKYEEEL